MSTIDSRRMISRRTVAYLAVLFVPWTVQVLPEGLFFVFPWGLANTQSFRVVTLTAYLFEFSAGIAGLPDWLLAWPVSVVVYACALASRALARVRWEDVRVTAGLLAIAGLAHLRVTLGLLGQGQVALPVGTVLLAALAWWTWSTRPRIDPVRGE